MNLEYSFSCFLYAFRLTDAAPAVPGDIWQRSALGPEKHFLFEHVEAFFLKNSAIAGVSDSSCCIQYELKKGALSESEKEKMYLLTRLFGKVACCGDGQEIKFRLIADGTILSPHLLHHPLTGICILSFAFALRQENNTLQNIIDFNYCSRNFDRNDSTIFLTARNKHSEALLHEERIAQKLCELEGRQPDSETQFHRWSIGTLITLLMQDWKACCTELSPMRLQAFTYVQTSKKLSEEDLLTASFRLRRLYNNRYTPPKRFLESSEETLETFAQIHFGASIEGCAIFINEDADHLPHFLKDYDLPVKNRLLWTYLLAYFQRLALVEMNKDLAQLFEHGSPGKERLLLTSSKLSKIQLRSLFTQISRYSQHNEFYDFCKHNLKLEELFAEVKSKLDNINQIVRQQLSEEEKSKEKKRERKDRTLEVLIAVLLVPELVYELLSMLAHSFHIEFPDHAKQGEPPLTDVSLRMRYILLGVVALLMFTLLPFLIKIYGEYFQIMRTWITGKERDDDAGLKKRFTPE